MNETSAEEDFLTELIDSHAAYIEALLRAHGQDEELVIKPCIFHYRAAFAHGWKHKQEYDEMMARGDHDQR